MSRASASKPRVATLTPVPVSSRDAWIIAHLAILAIAFIAFAFATHLTFHFDPPRAMDHYQYQANCWMHGKLEACDASGNNLNCIDCAIRNGKFQTTYPPLPGTAQFLLNNVLKLGVPSPAITYILAIASLYLFLWFARDLLMNTQQASEKQALTAATVGVLLLGSSFPFLHIVTISYAWSQAIAAGELCALASVYLSFRYWRSPSPRLALAAGALAGAATLCKQNFFPVFLPVLALIIGRSASSNLPWIKTAIRVVTPVIVCVSLLLTWSYVRMGDPFDGGVPDELKPQIHRIPMNFWNHFVALFDFRVYDFPMFFGHSVNFGGINRADGSGGLLHNYPMFAIWWAQPYLFLAPVAFIWGIVRLFRFGTRDARALWWIYLPICAASVFALYLTLDSSWARYHYDISFLLALAAVSVCFHIIQRWPQRTIRLLLPVLLTATIGWQLLIAADQNVAAFVSRRNPMIYMTYIMPAGGMDARARLNQWRAQTFDHRAPQNFTGSVNEEALWRAPYRTNWFHPDTNTAHVFDGYRWVCSTICGPKGKLWLTLGNAPGGAEPLIVWGKQRENAEVLGLERTALNRAMFFVGHGFSRDFTGAPEFVTTNERHLLEYEFDTILGEAFVKLDGRVVVHSALAAAGTPDSMEFGRNTIQSTLTLPQLGGTLEYAGR